MPNLDRKYLLGAGVLVALIIVGVAGFFIYQQQKSSQVPVNNQANVQQDVKK